MTRASSRHLPLRAIPVVVVALAILGGTAGLLLGVAESELEAIRGCLRRGVNPT